MKLLIFLIIIEIVILIIINLLLKETFEIKNNTQIICSRPEHKNYKDCYEDLWKRNFGKLDCKVCNMMYYTVNIRQNKDRSQNYTSFINDLVLLLEKYPNFPEDCRHIGSFLTNITQCSTNKEEIAIANAINMYIQMEKLHISFSDGGKYMDRNAFKTNNITIFEGYLPNHPGENLFKNVFIDDIKVILINYPVILELYKRAMKMLLSEKRSITYKVYNGTEKKYIDNFLFI
jgi:hypothetical protein